MLKKFRKKQDEMTQIYIGSAQSGSIFAIYKLFNRYYIKSFFGPFFSFAFPVLIYGILGSLMDPKLMFGGVVAMTCMSGLTSMPFSILELKKSVLMKRIGASPVKTSKFTFVIVSYFVFEIFLSILWLMLWGLIIYRDTSIFEFLSNTIRFFSFFYGTILTIILSISLGFLISSISKSENQAQAISMLIMFPSQFLSGMFISIELIAKNDVMNWISRLVPYRYTTMYLISSVQPDINPFIFNDLVGVIPISGEDAYNLGKSGLNFSPVKAFTFFKDWETIVGYVYPYLIIAVSTFVTIKKFSWSASR